MEQLQQFFNILPPELQEKIAMLEPEEQQQVLMDLMQRYQDSQSEYAQMGAMAESQKVPVEAERNETITTQDGSMPQVEGGYLKQKSYNPVSGQATWEIPNNKHNNTHEQTGNGSAMTGVNMMLKEGDVVNSDKTIIPTDISIMGRNFKGKTFKQASDYIAKKEKEVQDKFEDNAKKGKADMVSQGSASLMLAKLGNDRNKLNELQEMTLEIRKQKGENLERGYAKYGSFANKQYDDLQKKPFTKDRMVESKVNRYVNTYFAPYPSISAEEGFSGASETISQIKGLIAEQVQNTYNSVNNNSLGTYGLDWKKNKGAIKKATGIDNPIDFLRNPKAQEATMDYIIEKKLFPEASTLKTKYQLPFTLSQLIPMLHFEDAQSLEKKAKNRNLTYTEFENKFAPKPKQAAYGMTIPGSDFMGGRKDYILDANYARGGRIYAQNGKGITPSGIDLATVMGDDPIASLDYVQGISPQDFPVKDYNIWNRFIEDIKTDPDFAQDITNAEKVASTYKDKKGWEKYAKDTKFGKVHRELYPAYAKWVEKQMQFESPKYALEDIDATTPVTPLPATKTEAALEEPVAEQTTWKYPEQEKATWADKARYYADELIPYLDNLRLLMERRIMPVLQQKPYYNPYESMRTDVNIQPALNEVDRSTLTAIADSRGNPSVRNARIAQVTANAQTAKNQLYGQKYNMEQQLKNQKLLGEYDYLNKWTDTNMALRKQYEREVLQTIENQRQQQHMALQKMANDYLRGKETKQALEVALADTPYVFDKYLGKLVIDPVKAAREYQYVKTITGSQASSIPEGYKLVPKYSLEKEKDTNAKYGTTTKKKKLSLKNYY